MLSKRWVIGVSSALLIVLLLTGYMAIAAELGSKEDPLVTLSYIEELMPELQKAIDSAVGQKTAEFDAALDTKISEAAKSIDDKIQQFEAQYADGVTDAAFVLAVADAVIAKNGGVSSSGGSEASSGAMFEVVKITSGQTVICEVGTEILWRIGSATCVADGAPGLIDTSSGGDLANGAALQQNHVYVATVEGRGFKATADCTILIKGPYTIQ